MKKFEKENLEEVINYQFQLNGYDVNFDYVQENYPDSSKWLTDYVTTPEKEKEFSDWLTVYLRPFIPKRSIKKEVGYFILNYGLAINYGT